MSNKFCLFRSLTVTIPNINFNFIGVTNRVKNQTPARTTEDILIEFKPILERTTLRINEPNVQQTIDMIIEQRNELMKILVRKDNTIKHMSLQINGLEKQLQSAVGQKYDALARMEAIERKEIILSFKEKEMNFEIERLQNQIENLNENLTKNVIQLKAVCQELASASAQFEKDLKGKSEELRIANLKLCESNSSIQILTMQNEEYACKLKEQSNRSDELMQVYDNDLKAKTDLVESYKRNSDDYQAQIDELTVNRLQLRQLFDEVVDQCGILQTKLKENESQNLTESDAKDEIITKLKQELEDANCLLKTYHNDDDTNIQIAHIFPISNNYHLKKGMTITEIFTQYCNVVKELSDKEQECKLSDMEMKSVIEDVKKKSVVFEEQRSELRKLLAINNKLIEEKQNNFEDQKEIRPRRTENNQMEFGSKFYQTESKKILLSVLTINDRADTKLHFPIDENFNQNSNTVELCEQNQQHEQSAAESIGSIIMAEEVVQVEENVVLNSPKLTNTEPQETDSESLRTTSTSTLQADILKRALNKQDARQRRILNKRVGVSSSSESSNDEELVNVGDGNSDFDVPSIELKFLAVLPTQHQTQFNG